MEIRNELDRLTAYLDGIGAVLGYSRRAAAMRAYCAGLLPPDGRKSVELLAARLDARRVQALHQSLHHMVAKAEWDDAAVLGAVRDRVLPAIERSGSVRCWIVDEVCLVKQGGHSVGVARQPCGGSGREANCQVAVCLWVANEHASLPVAYQLFLPPTWVGDPARRSRAGVPDAAKAETKAMISLRQIREARSGGVPAGIVLGGVDHGGDAGFRSGVSSLGLLYALVVPPSIKLWPGTGGPTPVSAAACAAGLPQRAWRRAGGAGPPSRFAALRVHAAPPSVSNGEEWLLIEQPDGGARPAKHLLSNLPPSTALRDLVRAARGGMRIERDRRELEQAIGLAHYEGRGWRGFHHHASLCIIAYGFVVAERCLPSRRLSPKLPPLSELPLGFRPRGASRP